MFIRSRSSLENHTSFQTKMGKVYMPVFRPKRPKKHTLWAAHIYIAYIREYPPGIFGEHLPLSFSFFPCVNIFFHFPHTFSKVPSLNSPCYLFIFYLFLYCLAVFKNVRMEPH